MKHISTLLSGDSIKPIDHDFKADTDLPEEAKNLVNHLFKVLERHIAYFRVTNKNTQEINFTKREWVKCFSLNNITEEMVEKGVNSIRTSTGKINNMTPGEFINLCRPKKENKWQHDTIDRTYMFVKGIESDEHKEKKKKVALSHIQKMKGFL